MPHAQLYLSIAPLAPAEAEAALAAVSALQARVVRAIRQSAGGELLLLGIEAERTVRDESPVWCLDKLAAGVWNEIGRYARISASWQQGDEDEHWYEYGEEDYQRLMRAFRLMKRRA
ncbi:hypothetical protein [Chitinolyticbacter meiyuanensis]|uniref:hypothetical protein n=1 Tax=Chitinolyticbacter meiyuanensis TaxID=682798 RepID=UPI0011E5CCC2|nr:hypothetical protein [Chitinolyticbacter meiyuanensis]